MFQRLLNSVVMSVTPTKDPGDLEASHTTPDSNDTPSTSERAGTSQSTVSADTSNSGESSSLLTTDRSKSDGGTTSTKEAEESDGDEEDSSTLSNLIAFMKDKMKLGGTASDKEDEDVDGVKRVLSTLDIDGVVEYIKSGKCKNIITMAGAGISTSAGIPDFRSPGSGLYSNLQKYNLPYPEAIFQLDYFTRNPQPFFALAKELYPGSFNPTPCHYFIKLLEKKGLLLRHYTQNIDTLEHVAGISEEKLVEAHGSFRTAHCLQCRQKYDQDWVKEEVFADRIPACESCKGIVKPDIVFFGEGLPGLFHRRLSSDFPQCDLLIIMGTSLTVQPFASLVDHVSRECPRLLINRESVCPDSVDDLVMRLMGSSARQGLQLNSAHNTRDVALLGDCDDGCMKLVELLDWKDDFEKLMVEEKSKTDSKDIKTSSM